MGSEILADTIIKADEGYGFAVGAYEMPVIQFDDRHPLRMASLDTTAADHAFILRIPEARVMFGKLQSFGKSLVKVFLRFLPCFLLCSFLAYGGDVPDVVPAAPQAYHQAGRAYDEDSVEQSAETGLPGGVVGEEVDQVKDVCVHMEILSFFCYVLLAFGAMVWIWLPFRVFGLWLYYRTLCIEQDVRLERW